VSTLVDTIYGVRDGVSVPAVDIDALWCVLAAAADMPAPKQAHPWRSTAAQRIELMQMRFLSDMTRADIAMRLGLSVAEVRRVESVLLAYCRHPRRQDAFRVREPAS